MVAYAIRLLAAALIIALGIFRGCILTMQWYERRTSAMQAAQFPTSSKSQHAIVQSVACTSSPTLAKNIMKVSASVCQSTTYVPQPSYLSFPELRTCLLGEWPVRLGSATAGNATRVAHTAIFPAVAACIQSLRAARLNGMLAQAQCVPPGVFSYEMEALLTRYSALSMKRFQEPIRGLANSTPILRWVDRAGFEGLGDHQRGLMTAIILALAAPRAFLLDDDANVTRNYPIGELWTTCPGQNGYVWRAPNSWREDLSKVPYRLQADFGRKEFVPGLNWDGATLLGPHTTIAVHNRQDARLWSIVHRLLLGGVRLTNATTSDHMDGHSPFVSFTTNVLKPENFAHDSDTMSQRAFLWAHTTAENSHALSSLCDALPAEVAGLLFNNNDTTICSARRITELSSVRSWIQLGRLFNFFFWPTERLVNSIAPAYHHYHPGDQWVISIHMRWGAPQQGANYVDNVRDGGNDVQAILGNIVSCAGAIVLELNRSHGLRKRVLWYVASDNPTTVQALRKIAPMGVEFAGLGITRITHTGRSRFSANETALREEGTVATYAEQFLLSTAHGMIRSRSGFSLIAEAWGAIPLIHTVYERCAQ